MTLKKPRAIIFDWDNTLVNTWPVIHAALHKTFVEMGREPWTLEYVQRHVRKSLRDSFPEIFGDEWRRAGDLYQKYYQESHLAKLEALAEAEMALKMLKERGIPRFLVSNKKGHNLRKEVAHLGWEDLFDRVVGADDAARDKPHPDPVHLALEGSGLKPGPDIWFVGDSEVDLACAQATFCTPILYGDIAAQHPDYSFDNLQGFPYVKHVLGHGELIQLLK